MSNSDEFNRTAKNPWNQIFMRNDDDGPKNEEYKISSSLKTIWGDSSDDRTTCSHSNTDNNVAQGFLTQTHQPQREYVQFGNNVISIENVQPNPVRAFGTESYHNVVNNGVHPNTLKRRAITSRNGGYNTHFGNENYENQSNSLALSNSSMMSNSSFQSSSSALSPPAPQQSQQLEAFLQKVQVIVKNGFLDQKILSEPISPETFDLIQMLIFYVMEYGRAKSQSSLDEIENTFHKINLIQHEISKCQSHYLEHTRAQQQIVDSFSALDLRQPNFTGQPLTTQYRQTNVRYAWQNVPKPETTNQRFGQRQFDQYAQQPSASASRNYTFLPKAKNVDKRSANRFYSSRDGNFPPN